MRVGILGCGVISREYARNAAAFDSFELVACADLDRDAAAALAREHGLEPMGVPELVADTAIDVLLNLTPPSAHGPVVRDALAAGKHVYSEKPLATETDEAARLVADAEARGLALGCAPDIFLGSGYQRARALVDEGAIGEPVAVDAAMLAGGQAAWHPGPDIFYRDGAGPLLDMGPYYLTAIVALLGPVERVAGIASTRTVEREILVGPRAGERFRAETPTHVVAVMELAGGATANLVSSFEAPSCYVADFAVHGTEGSLVLPDPNSFHRTIRLRRGRGEWETVTAAPAGGRDARGVGLDDLVRSVGERRSPRASGRLALHVVDVARSVLAAGARGETVEVGTTVERPAPLQVEPSPAPTD